MKKAIPILLFVLAALVSAEAQTARWLCKPTYAAIRYLGNGLFKVKGDNGKWGIVNRSGELTVPVQHDSITYLKDDRILVLDASGQTLLGIVDGMGRKIRTFQPGEYFVSAGYPYFNEHLLVVSAPGEQYMYFGYLNDKGDVQIPLNYFHAAPFSEGKAAVHYTSNKFGLINSTGAPAVIDNRSFFFMSSPAAGKVLAVMNGRKGGVVSLLSIRNGRFDEDRELESKVIPQRSNDYRTLSCQNGKSYYFDEQIRLTHSSTENFLSAEEQVSVPIPVSDSGKLTSFKAEGRYGLNYAGITLLPAQFREIEGTYEEAFAIVEHTNGKTGILEIQKEERRAGWEISSSALEFYHATPELLSVLVFMPESKEATTPVIRAIRPDGTELSFECIRKEGNRYYMRTSYFKAEREADVESSESVHVNLERDEIIYQTDTWNLKSVHRPGFSCLEPRLPAFSEPDGSAAVTFSVRSLHGMPSGSARVTVSGSEAGSRTVQFQANGMAEATLTVRVPEDTSRTFTFTVTVTEEGCPSLVKQFSRTIKHYVLQ